MGFLAIVAAYLIGSIPFGYIFTRLFKRVDIRHYGSGNIGATNVLRLLGWRAALPVFLLDLGKGSAAVLLARACSSETVVVLAAALAVLVGHCFPLFLKFKGGKGAATGIGLLIPLSGPVCASVVILAVIVIALTRYVSLGSIIGAFSVPFFLLFFGYEPLYLLFGAAMALLVIFRHRENIGRLLSGTEPKLGQKVKLNGEEKS
ncbi:MAG: glycerol-3-phosphate 1-O-acyltransferase PlsY [Dethiobacteria bacterium]|jgi:glycerol-3-phosphate acyltransferase PlsY|nr:glycerol-3-phosphate 1-O-acyltransferase PlsY [Bacillota bacterium]NMD33637.1 glycerol-3-phosphate 1-O-acyltransferase PlsY [Bacillota bacterium]HOB28416.1 glycerol-3-phosphate 1-O-acyltransferase PlsY [Bacillota bacterium]HPZ41204.1 glycerol-3-phosphate 1-O-acyltransferase PlsY [Bacillota bacterium]HQD51967.1 glycerol-3-phosphate 1-O-acyltransferase PlsY [Bacillota bacterium]